MKADLNRRLSALEGASGPEEMVKFSYQWIHHDGTPAGPKIERMVPRSRAAKLGWVGMATRKRRESEPSGSKRRTRTFFPVGAAEVEYDRRL